MIKWFQQILLGQRVVHSIKRATRQVTRYIARQIFSMISSLLFDNRFKVEHYRGGKLIGVYEGCNDITTEGKNYLLDVMFGGTTAASPWYIGLINNTPTPTLAATDDYDNITQASNDWDEFTNYEISAAAVRGTWDEGSASGGSMTNSTPITCIIQAGGGVVYGIFICGLGANASVHGDHANDGKLWATAPFSGGAVTLSSSDELKITYTVNA